MSTAVAYDPARRGSAPLPSGAAPGAAPVELEAVAARAVRRARPRVVLAGMTVAGVGGILAAQLLLSIGTDAQAYALHSLQATSTTLTRERDVQVEALQRLAAPQHLARAAVGLGLVPSVTPAYLRLGDGRVLGSAAPASGKAAVGTGAVPDALLAGSR